jgi:putative phosphoesterase
MKIGVISDTHIPMRAKQLPDQVIQAFKDVDHIIHAGDIASLEVLDLLERFAPVTAVSGNVDSVNIEETLGVKKLITLNGYRIGITHGHGSSGSTVDRAVKCFENDSVDCIIFGHSHIPYCEKINNILLFNPGSPTDKRRNEFYSFGLLELEDDEIKARHILFEKDN